MNWLDFALIAIMVVSAVVGIFKGFAVAGVEPEEMGIGPALAVPRLLKRHGLKPGDIFVLEKEKIAIEEISSHKIPLMVLISYLEQSIECRVTVLGIQARDLSFGTPVSPVIKAAVKTVSDFLAGIIAGAKPGKNS